MPDAVAVIGLAADVAPVVAAAARAGRNALQGNAEERAVRSVANRALTRVVDAEPLELAQKEALFDLVWSLLEVADELKWLASASPVEILDDRLEPVRATPHAAAVLVAFRDAFLEDLRAEAGRADSPLANRFLVEHVAETLNEVRRVAAQVRDQRPQPPGTDALDRLPPTTSVLLSQLRSADAQLAQLLVTKLSTSDEAASTVGGLLHEPPGWFTDAPWEALAAVGEYAAGHELMDEAAQAFARAAEAAGAGKARWLARAACVAADSDLQRAEELICAARAASPSGDQSRFIEVVEAAITEDPGKMIAAGRRALADGSPEPVLVASFTAQALEMRGNRDEAIEILQSARERSPWAAGLLTLLANALIRRAENPHARNRLHDAREARVAAVRARDLRRRWGGRTSDAVLAACQAAAIELDWDGILDLATVERGATTAEANSAPVARLVAFARMNTGLADSGEADRVTTAIGNATRAMAEGNVDEARAMLRDAATSADTLESLASALRALATAGVEDLPRIEEIEADDADHGAVLRAIAATHAGRLTDGIARLRALAGRSRLAAMFLSFALEERGEIEDAAGAAETAAERFADAHLALRAAMLFGASGKYTACDRAADAGLPHAPPNSPVRRQLRECLLESAAARNDVEAVERAARTAIAEGDRTANVRWALVQALQRRRRLRAAWSELVATPPLRIGRPGLAELALHIHARAAPENVAFAADICDQFSDSPDVVATGCMLFLTVDAEGTNDEDGAERMRRHLDNFVHRFPDHPALRAIDVPDETDVLLETLRGHLQRPPEYERAARDLVERASSGSIPFGLVVEVLGRTYVPALLAVDYVGFTSTPADMSEFQRQCDTAAAALNGDVIVDPSTLVMASFLDDSVWMVVVGAFSSLEMTEAMHAHVDDLVFVKPPSGHLSWDYATNSVTVSDYDDGQIARLRTRRRWIRDRAEELGWTRDVPPSTLSSALSNDDSWAASIAAAGATGMTLLTDDLGSARLAQASGVPAFGLVALLTALVRPNQLSAGQLDAAIRALFTAQVDDLPVEPEALVTLAAECDWPPAPSLHPLTRSHVWVDLSVGVRLVATLAEEVGGNSALADAVHCGALGISRTGHLAPEKLVGLLVARLIDVKTLEPNAVKKVLDAARYACASQDLPDPLPHAVDAYVSLAIADVDAGGAGGDRVTRVFSALNEADRHVVVARVLDIPAPAMSARDLLQSPDRHHPSPAAPKGDEPPNGDEADR